MEVSEPFRALDVPRHIQEKLAGDSILPAYARLVTVIAYQNADKSWGRHPGYSPFLVKAVADKASTLSFVSETHLGINASNLRFLHKDPRVSNNVRNTVAFIDPRTVREGLTPLVSVGNRGVRVNVNFTEQGPDVYVSDIRAHKESWGKPIGPKNPVLRLGKSPKNTEFNFEDSGSIVAPSQAAIRFFGVPTNILPEEHPYRQQNPDTRQVVAMLVTDIQTVTNYPTAVYWDQK